MCFPDGQRQEWGNEPKALHPYETVRSLTEEVIYPKAKAASEGSAQSPSEGLCLHLGSVCAGVKPDIESRVITHSIADSTS